MSDSIESLPRLPERVRAFAARVVREFVANRGVLLAGGVGYNVLLSIIPLFIVTGVLISRFFDVDQFTNTLRAQLSLLAPAHAEAVTDAIAPFLRQPDLIGVIGFLVLLFFSSLAFRMLEDAIAIIFRVHRLPRRRSPWFSVLVPYAFVGVLTLGLFALTLLVGVVDGFGDRDLAIDGVEVTLSTSARVLAYALGFVGLGLLFTALYKVLPVVHVDPISALVGGFVAAGLWESVLQLLVWYFEHVSLVDTVYGPFASVVVVLLGLEVGAGIMLFGAQIIAELEGSAAAGVPWWVDPDSTQ